MKHTRLLPALTALALLGCEDKPTAVFGEAPTQEALTGAWSGMEEITTDDDLSWNSTYGDTRGFAFPVVIRFDEFGQFALTTANYSTSYDNEASRSCAGTYTKENQTLQLFPSTLCRALPLSRYTIGRTLPDGISLEARTGVAINSSASFVTLRVRFRLSPQ